MSVAIIGAGICGLTLSNNLVDRGARAVEIFEKSNALGGRVATRRVSAGKMDHGAQFYSLKPDELPPVWHERWRRRLHARVWNSPQGIERLVCPTGMNDLAKSLADGLVIQKNRKLVALSRSGPQWSLHLDPVRSMEKGTVAKADAITESIAKKGMVEEGRLEEGRLEEGMSEEGMSEEGKSEEGKARVGANSLWDFVILTCPLPQSIEILQASGIEIPQSLSAISYAKALVVLLEDMRLGDQALGSFESTQTRSSTDNPVPVPEDYWENPRAAEPSAAVFSIADQRSKGLTSALCWTVVMTPAWSEAHFMSEDAQTLENASRELRKLFPRLSWGASQLKKWKFSHPLQTFSHPFFEVQSGLYLAGDAFGGPSIRGALRSALALAGHLPDHFPDLLKNHPKGSR